MGSETSILRSKWSQNGSQKSPQGHLGHPLGALGTMLGASGASGSLCGALGGLFGSSGEVFGSSLGRFWEYFGSIFDGFWSVFWISSETNYEALFSWFSDNFLLLFLYLAENVEIAPTRKNPMYLQLFRVILEALVSLLMSLFSFVFLNYLDVSLDV